MAYVLQFVHFGRGSGRLNLVRDEEEALSLFESGRLIGPDGSSDTGIGDISLAEGLVAPKELAALRRRPGDAPLAPAPARTTQCSSSEGHPPSLGYLDLLVDAPSLRVSDVVLRAEEQAELDAKR